LIGLVGLVGLLAWADSAASQVGETALSSARAPGTATIYTTTVTLSTYPYANCLQPPQFGVAGVPYQALDWDCLAAAGPPVSQTYRLLVLSNDYLTATVLPELGGRVYELIFKPTGHSEFYRNPVLKPTQWGPSEQGWWLAAGGLEWGFPTDEHGYEWGVPWHYQVARSSAGVTVTLRDSNAVNRPTVSVAVHLPTDQAVLFVRPQIRNASAAAVDVKYWTAAMLAPGAANAPSPDLRFLFPGEHVVVHSTGDIDLPQPGELMDWPVYGGRDYSRLGNWNRWLGFFEAPQAHGPFAGVYDTAADEGVLRVFPASVARGSKGFAVGWKDRLPSSWWTDDGSGYVEVHGGLAPTFWDTVALPPGQVIGWTEAWYPLAGLGGVSGANEKVALRLEREGDGLALGLYTPAAHPYVDLYLWDADCTTVGHWQPTGVDPAHPVRFSVPTTGSTLDELSLVAFSAEGAFLGGVNARDCLPPFASVEPLPSYVTTPTFTVTWRGNDVWSGIRDYDVQYRIGYEGDWVDWLTGTTALSATLTGDAGRTYFFRARAHDKAGNRGDFGDPEWGEAFTSVLLTPAPVLVTSRKLVMPAAPDWGQPVTYSVILSNTGNLTATALVLTDTLPAMLALVSGTLEASACSQLVWSGDVMTCRGMLPPGQELRVGFTLTPTSTTPAGLPLTNTIWMLADGVAPLVRWTTITYWHYLNLPLMVKD